MTSYLLLPPPCVTCTTGLRTIPLGASVPSSSTGDVPLGKPGLGWGHVEEIPPPSPPWDRLTSPDSLREDFDLCLPLARGSPGRGGRRARPLCAHVDSTAPRCRRDTETPWVPQGCQPSPSGWTDPQDPAGQRGAWQGVGTGVVRRGFPALARRRDRSWRKLKGVRGRAARRRMLTAVGLNAASATPPISRRREFSVSKQHRPRPGCPRVPQGARLLARAQEGVRCPQRPPECRRAEEADTGLAPGPKAAGRVWGVGAGMAGGQRAGTPPEPLPKVRNSRRARAAGGTRGAARQPFHMSRY